MKQIVPWKHDTSRADLQRAVEILRAGGLVGFPTETGYAAAAFATNAEAVSSLAKYSTNLAVLLSVPSRIRDWLPDVSPIGMRLARKLWPGPLVIVGSDGFEHGLMRDVPENVRGSLMQQDGLAFRSSIHEVPWELAAEPEALVLAEIGPKDQQASSADELAEQWGEKLEIVFDGGPTPTDKSPTMLRLTGMDWTVDAADAISQDAVADAARCRVVFVCTGNTCRSPMAEAFFRNELADLLGCSTDELERHGFIVQSAGLSAAPGCPATEESRKIAAELGGDLRNHRSRLMTLELLLQSDYVLAMTQTHLTVLRNNLFMDGPLCCLLSDDDIADPFGCPEEVYRECAQHILQCVKEWAPRIQHDEEAVQPRTADRPNG